MEYKFLDKAIFFEEEKILVIADLHFGYEKNLEDSGIFIPRSQYKIIKENLEKIFKTTGRLKEIIILGDLKHQFGNIFRQEWKEINNFLNFLEENSERIILIKGNHDGELGQIKNREKVETKNFYVKENLAFLHGNKKYLKVLDKKIKYLFLGHFHPAILLKDNVKRENYKCFLKGKWEGKEVLILPSFFPLTEGVDVNIYDTNLDYDFDLKNFEVFVPVNEKEILDFGKVKDVGRLR